MGGVFLVIQRSTRSIRVSDTVAKKLYRIRDELSMSSVNDVIVLLLSHYEKCMKRGGVEHDTGSG